VVPAKRDRNNPSVLPVKLLSVDDGSFMQAPIVAGATSPQSFRPPHDRDKEAIGAMPCRSEKQITVVAVRGLRRLAANPCRPRFAPRQRREPGMVRKQPRDLVAVL